ncbi:DUF4333 domain-containing protein [Saccharomonospora sp. NPDC006951]
MRNTRFLLPVLAVVLGVLTGCSGQAGTGNTVTKEELQDRVADAVEDDGTERPDNVDCPNDLSAEEGERTRCILTRQATNYGVDVEVTTAGGENVSFSVQVDENPMK